MSFWNDLQKPIFALAPMEDVTDTVFRQLIREVNSTDGQIRPDVMFTEFTSVEGIESEGADMVMKRLKYTETERPLVAQIWGITPENYYNSAKKIVEMGFDGIDINMGCPVRKVIQKGACSALIKNPALAREIVMATQEGAGDLPVSVKTRIGFSKIQTEEWIGFLLEEAKPTVLTVHGRTVKELSKVPNHWEEIGTAVKFRNEIQKDLSEKTLILGNGDISSYQEGIEKIELYGLDGVMIGRGVFENPWIFNPDVKIEEKTKVEKLKLMEKHIQLFSETWGENKSFNVLKKYFKIYINGFRGAKELRMQFMECENAKEALLLLENV